MVQIRGIAFDFGNILAQFDHMKACRKLASYGQASPENILEMLFTGDRAPAKLHEAGQISSEEFFVRVCKGAGLSEGLTFEKFCAIWKDIFWENDGVSSVLDRIRPDVKRCILSNTDPIHWSAIELLPVIKKYFSDPQMLVRSYTSGTRKPDPKMYQDALKCLGVSEEDARHILYVDDITEYCLAFEHMGGNTLLYDCSKDPIAKLEAGLEAFGVLKE